MKIVTGDKAKVLRWARKHNRGILWRQGKTWHASTTKKHVPNYAEEVEEIGVVGVEMEFPRRNHVGKQLAFLRESCGLTQAQLAKRMS